MPGPATPHDRPRRPSPAERRERRAAVEDVGEVLDAAARLLEGRPRAVAEVRRRLTHAGYRATLVEAAIARLLELGYLDDEAFARAWVESRDRAHPRGERALQRELALRGVDRGLVDGVLDDRRSAHPPADGVPEPADPDETAAARLLERRAATLLREPDPRRRRSRAYALLARNGFDPEVCARVVGAWLAPAEDEPTAD